MRALLDRVRSIRFASSRDRLRTGYVRRRRGSGERREPLTAPRKEFIVKIEGNW
jgi:hypothetical protein